MTTRDERAALEARLRRPDAGENGWDEGREELSRLRAVEQLGAMVRAGKISITAQSGGINTHVHTSKSFSSFASPSDAAWQARVAALAVFGINDHYTLAGHAEFRAACETLGIAATFSMEAIAMWEAARDAVETVNDPTNPGRTYFTAKGVTRDFPIDCDGERDLDRMNAALLERNSEMTSRLARWIDERLGAPGAIRFEDVLVLTPHDQPTERHIAYAAAQFLNKRYQSPAERRSAVERLCQSAPDEGVIESPARFQDFLRSRLLKAGGPAFVEESADAFIPIERMVAMSIDLGAIPTYPVLGNPITPWEEDLDVLFDRLDAIGACAIEVIPDRNTDKRLLDIVRTAEKRHFPVFNGTEHNTPSPLPLVDRFFFDKRFRPAFERGARVLLGHQALRAQGEEGFVGDDGKLAARTRAARVKACDKAGAAVLRGLAPKK